MFKEKLFRFPLDVMLICVVSIQILEKIYKTCMKKCDNHNIKQYSDQNFWKLLLNYKLIFSCLFPMPLDWQSLPSVFLTYEWCIDKDAGLKIVFS